MFLEGLIRKAAEHSKKTVAVAQAGDQGVLEAVAQAVQLGLANFLLYGNKEKIMAVLKQHHPELLEDEAITIYHYPLANEAAREAVKSVSEKKANVLMKGHVQTSVILKAVLDRDFGLRSESILSHTAVFEVPGYNRPILVTDAAMNIAPDLAEKAAIVKNASLLAQSIGISVPKVAPICAVETVNSKMQATLDAASLAAMNQRGQISGCIIDGPLALDNAVSSLAAEHKGITSDVAGKADILLVPTVEAGNILYKSLVYFARAKVGAVICGAKAPIILTSRSDSSESKLYSLAVALCSSTHIRD
ncbi:phosphate butyryltransferase [Neobacillus notoginsengisoli]|uniref:Phosphate butyryltransferase n=1 Tax=Neobacillus notoginsengisoli TaxID=1578198 RepID=A0A417YV04_9BACI|nr:phosphate butyryltransferase [Neobacillus notoginsengisoli]RHW41131.1 phosphate butyryltransferase [Neobacillus notoginsengisoli]